MGPSHAKKGARRHLPDCDLKSAATADRKTKPTWEPGGSPNWQVSWRFILQINLEPQFIHLSKNTTHFGKPTRIVPPNADQGAEHSHTLQTDSCSTTSIKLKVFVASPARASDLNCVRGNWRLERCDRNVDLQSPQILWLDSFLSYPRG